jgi:VanZ family protein
MTARTVFQAAAWLCIVAIGVLSLVAPSLRPVTFLPQSLEHAAIFVAAGLAAALGYPNRSPLLLAAFVVFAAAIELAQLFAPGRHARVADFAVDASAACTGVLLAMLIARWRPRIAEGS